MVVKSVTDPKRGCQHLAKLAINPVELSTNANKETHSIRFVIVVVFDGVRFCCCCCCHYVRWSVYDNTTRVSDLDNLGGVRKSRKRRRRRPHSKNSKLRCVCLRTCCHYLNISHTQKRARVVDPSVRCTHPQERGGFTSVRCV